MESLKHRITIKIIIGYLILGLSSTFFGYLVLSEIKNFTQLQGKDITDNTNILKVGSIIADIYENESLGRAAIQLNSTRKFNQYLNENDELLLKIDSLSFFTNNKSQTFIVDSIKVFINKKLKNLKDLKRVKRSYNSDKPINNVIDQLGTIDSLLNKAFMDDILKKIELLNSQKRLKFRKFKKELNKQTIDTTNFDQRKIDSLIAVSKNLLKSNQKKSSNQKISLFRKEKQLIANDLIISRKLRELLNTLKAGIINYTNEVNKQKEKSFDRSRKIILSAAVISLLIIIIFSIIFLSDFWKNQRYRKQLEKANKRTSSLLKSREQLISMVSHDLRTPLSTITGYSELLQKVTYSIKEKNYLEHINSASSYMKQLVDDLMEFSTIENGSIALKSIPFDIKKTIDETVASAENIMDKPVKFVTDHDPLIKNNIVSDPFRLKQILNNLITNACKFTDEGTITVKSRLFKTNHKISLKISVTDTGIGIPKNQQKTIFKAFTQVDDNFNKNGFGLGLTISKKLIELLKGTIYLTSKIGKGSTFTINIPVELTNKPISVSSQPKIQPIYDLTAVIVEDDTSIKELLKEILNQYKIKTYIYNNAQEALSEIDEISFDMVFTDIQLPKMNGIHFMEVLKTRTTYKNQPIIAMTGRLNLNREDYLKIGFYELISKPFKTIEIQKMLEKLSSNSTIFKTNNEIEKSASNYFNLKSLEAFFNFDYEKINNTLTIFLNDTKNNKLLLKEAKHKNDIKTFNAIGHKMVSMFKQIDVKTVIPFLENFETATSIDDNLFINFESALDEFILSLENYLN